jgi:hypothetical protein
MLKYSLSALAILTLSLPSGAAEADRQSLDDAWWTGPIVAAGAATLPQGRALIEPYVYDVVTRGRYDSDGNYRSSETVHSYGSLTYMLYGVTDSFTAGLIPTFGFNDLEDGHDSSGIGVGDRRCRRSGGCRSFAKARMCPLRRSCCNRHCRPASTIS